MTPQEYGFFIQLLESAAKAAYRHGYQDSTAKKPLSDAQFAITSEHALRIKTELTKFIQKR